MTPELHMLTWACALGLIHLLATVLANIGEHGIRYVFSARDAQKPSQGMPARLARAFRNFLESFPFFMAAVMMTHALDRHTALTVLGAQLYFWARLAYIPIYLSGVPVIRTLAWLASFAGIVMVLTAMG